MAKPTSPRDDFGERGLSPLTRRRFFAWLGWGSAALAGGGLTFGAGAYVFPRLSLEPSSAYPVGRPGEYQIGKMRLIQNRSVYIFRALEGFQAVSGICTHLGCAYKPYGAPDKEYDAVHAHCPCHGSVFRRDGSVLKGPAPRPLAFYAMSLSPDGRLFVDESINDGIRWKGIDPRIYLTPEGKQVVGPLPTGQDVFFG